MYSTVSRHTPGQFPRNAGWGKVEYIESKHNPLKSGHSWEPQASRNFSLQRLRTTSPLFEVILLSCYYTFEVILLSYVTVHSK